MIWQALVAPFLASEALRRAGARDVFAVFTHAVMAPGAEDTLLNAKFSKLLTSDSIPVESKPWLEVVPIVPVLAKAVRYIAGNDYRV